MSNKDVRVTLKFMLYILAIIAVLNFAMAAWPDPSVFTATQSLFVLASILLWAYTWIRFINWAVGLSPVICDDGA